jgi:hypothetical protein
MIRSSANINLATCTVTGPGLHACDSLTTAANHIVLRFSTNQTSICDVRAYASSILSESDYTTHFTSEVTPSSINQAIKAGSTDFASLNSSIWQ